MTPNLFSWLSFLIKKKKPAVELKLKTGMGWYEGRHEKTQNGSQANTSKSLTNIEHMRLSVLGCKDKIRRGESR